MQSSTSLAVQNFPDISQIFSERKKKEQTQKNQIAFPGNNIETSNWDALLQKELEGGLAERIAEDILLQLGQKFQSYIDPRVCFPTFFEIERMYWGFNFKKYLSEKTFTRCTEENSVIRKWIDYKNECRNTEKYEGQAQYHFKKIGLVVKEILVEKCIKLEKEQPLIHLNVDWMGEEYTANLRYNIVVRFWFTDENSLMYKSSALISSKIAEMKNKLFGWA